MKMNMNDMNMKMGHCYILLHRVPGFVYVFFLCGSRKLLVKGTMADVWLQERSSTCCWFLCSNCRPFRSYSQTTKTRGARIEALVKNIYIYIALCPQFS